MNNNTYCQYNGCIGGHITVVKRRWELTSFLRHIRDIFNIADVSVLEQVVNGDSYVKIICWRSKGKDKAS